MHQMARPTRFNRFLQRINSEDTADALRNTLAVVLPMLLFFYLDWPTTGIGIGVGTMIICMTDLPGNRRDKVNTAWLSILLFTAVAIITAWSTQHRPLMVVLMVVLTFILSMFGVLGNRMFVTGSLAIAVGTFTIGLKPENSLLYGSYIFYGGVWYYAISLLQIHLFPYRSLRRAIIETQRSTASLLELRASGYNPAQSLIGFNDKNIRLHLKLAQQHELLRQLLLTDRQTMRPENKKGNAFVAKGLNLIDLYEQVSAVHYDYPHIRKVLATTNALPLIEEIGQLFASELRISSNLSGQFIKLLAKLQDHISTATPEQRQVLQHIQINLVEIHDLIVALQQGAISNTIDDPKRYQEFLTSPQDSVKRIKHHFSLQSPVFRFALRLTLLSFAALILITYFAKEHYSYWILLTMIVVSRPSFGLTLKRNKQRLIGSVIGIALGWAVANLTTVPTQLIASAVFLFGFFAFNRLQYTWSVICITVAVILCLNLYEGQLWNLITGRMLFTVLGVLLCLGAAFLFPIWNAPRLSTLIKDVANANFSYFKAVNHIKPHDLHSIHQARLARKHSHQQLAFLSEAITAAAQEPFAKKVNWPLVKRLQLYHYKTNVLIASFGGMKKSGTANFTIQQISKFDQNFNEIISAADQLNLNATVALPVKADQPMTLMEVSGHLAELIKNPAYQRVNK